MIPLLSYFVQSDDKTLRVWRTLDWQQEACVEEPFQEVGYGSTYTY